MRKEYVTKSRTLIMEYIQEHKDSRFSAADIHEYMTQKGCPTNLATIYRNLDKLTEEAILLKCKTVDDNCCLYQYLESSSHCHEHLHIQCRVCGKIIHMGHDFMEDLVMRVTKQYGFAIECDSSVIMGVCSDCRQAG